MKSYLYVRLIVLIGFSFIAIAIQAQLKHTSLKINQSLFAFGNYAHGSSISIPLKINAQQDSFAVNNAFDMCIMPDSITPNNQYIPPQAIIIGSYDVLSSYTTHVNGYIPNNLSLHGWYWLRVHASSPMLWSDSVKIFIDSSTRAFKKINYKPVVGNGNAELLYTDISNYINIIGFCTPQQNTMSSCLLIDSSNYQTTDSIFLIRNCDSLGNDSLIYVGMKNKLHDTLQLMLQDGNTYTLYIKSADSFGFVASASYFLINPTWNMMYHLPKICVCISANDFQYYTIPFYNYASYKGIYKNFPGIYYCIDYGDGAIDTLTYFQIKNDNKFYFHQYSKGSCSLPNGYYLVRFYANHVFNNSLGTCSYPSLQYKYYLNDTAIINFSIPKKVLTNQKFYIQSQCYNGSLASSKTCNTQAIYTWFLDHQLYSTSAVPVSMFDDSASFSTLGKHIITLSLKNMQCDSIQPKTDTIEVVSALPNYFQYFQISKVGSANQLVWKLQNQINLKECIVERCNRNNLFEPIAKIPANSSADNLYVFVDGSIQAQIVYYRIKLIQLDGIITYSYVITCEPISMTKTLQPNHAHDFVLIHSRGLQQISITDMAGKIYLTKTITNFQNENKPYLLDISTLPKGLYMVYISNKLETTVQKLIKL